jgi:transcription antitermination factor NusB
MSSRRKGREFVLQMLFQEDISGSSPDEVRRLFWRTHSTDSETRRFTEVLFSKSLDERSHVDELIKRHARNWALDRMAAVDRNILRMAVSELLVGETPAIVVIDEAIEVARKFSTADSTEFVNGVLDSIRKELAGEMKENLE